MSDSRSRHPAERPLLHRLSTRARLLSRTTLILIPVHVAAFVLLYLLMLALVRSEILATHGSHAQLLLREAVNDLHPAMECGDREQVRLRLAEIAATHDLLSLRLFSSDGRPLVSDSELEPEVAAFVGGGSLERYWFSTTGNSLHMHGMQRIISHGQCNDCHDAGETVGLAAIDVDLSNQYTESRSRLQVNLALIIAGWGLAVGLVNVATWRLARRSVAGLRSELRGDRESAPRSMPSVSRAILDPVSAELYDSLREVLERQKERDDRVVSRLHHTERLASLGKLTAGLAHEIKNPLAGVQGTLELLRDEADDPERRDLYQQMLAELKRVNSTIHALLHFARPSPTRPADTEVAELLEDTVQLLRAGFAKRGIAVETSVAPSVDSFPLDRTQIRQVLLNLVHNAADAVDSDGTIRLRATALPGDEGLLITVADDGPGIAPEDQAKIFEPFHTSKFHGTGLGLAVARSLVERHGGRLEVRSEPGQGAEFLILLPPPSSPAADTPPAEGPS